MCTAADEVILLVILRGEAGPDQLKALGDVGEVWAVVDGGCPALLHQLHQGTWHLLAESVCSAQQSVSAAWTSCTIWQDS